MGKTMTAEQRAKRNAYNKEWKKIIQTINENGEKIIPKKPAHIPVNTTKETPKKEKPTSVNTTKRIAKNLMPTSVNTTKRKP